MRGKSRSIQREDVRYALCLLLLFLAALFVRVYKIGSAPEGIHADEAGMWYDVRSLLLWGTDRYYKRFPIYFINFGGGQNALYGYLCMICFALFGESITVMRLPAVILGMCTWLFGSLIFRECFSRKYALIGTFLLTIAPCFIMQSRLGLESLLFLPMSTISLYLLIKALQSRRRYLYALCGVFWGLSFYTYAVSYVTIPLFLLLLLLYLCYIGKTDWIGLLCMAVPVGLLGAPLLFMLLINALELPELATPWFTIPRLLEFRSSEISLKNVLPNFAALFQVYFFNDSLGYNSVSGFYTLYPLSVPFALFGIQKSMKEAAETCQRKEFHIPLILSLWFLAVSIMGLLTKDINVNKVNAVYFVLAFYVLTGLVSWIRWLEDRKLRFSKTGPALLGILYLCCFLSFQRFYYTDYRDVYSSGMFHDTYADILDRYSDVIKDKTVYVDGNYIYYALGEQLSPQELALTELGADSRGNIMFGLGNGVDENGFYIAGREAVGKRNHLEEEGFFWADEGFYRIYYK